MDQEAVAPVGVGHGEWQIHFARQRNKQLVNELLKGNKTERSSNRLLIKELTDRGVTAITAQQLLEDASIGQDRIRRKIEWSQIFASMDDIVFGNPVFWPRHGGFP